MLGKDTRSVHEWCRRRYTAVYREGGHRDPASSPLSRIMALSDPSATLYRQQKLSSLNPYSSLFKTIITVHVL